jgi:hypothetical protein
MSVIIVASSLFFLLLKTPKTLNEEQNELKFVQNTLLKDISDTAKLLISKRMLSIAPVIVWTSLSCSMTGAVIFPLMTDTMKMT